MDYVERFTDTELAHIMEEGFIYMCACPAQVAQAVRTLREVHRYQINCLQDSSNVAIVHQTIARSTALAHAQLESCLDEVLNLEQWDRATLRMPEGLRQRQFKHIEQD